MQIVRSRTRRKIMTTILLQALARALQLLPLSWVCALGRFAGASSYALDARHRRLALAHLRIAFPGKSDRERQAIARRMFQYLAEGALEFLTYYRANIAHCLAHVETENIAAVHEAMRGGKGFIFWTAHYGNWELLGIFGKAVLPDYKVCAVGRATKHAALYGFIQDIREVAGLKILAKGNALKQVLAMLRQGNIASFLADQVPGAEGVAVDFFGRETAAISMPARLSLKTGAPIIPVFMQRVSAGRHRIVYGRPIDPRRQGALEEDVRRMTQAAMRQLEEAIRQRPDHWLWLHKRWKSKKALKRFHDVTRVAVIAPHWLGDAVMSLPAQAMLRRLFPQAHASVFFPKGQQALYEGLRIADERIAYGWRPEGFAMNDRMAFVRRLRQGRYDMALLLPNSWDSAFAAWLAGIPHRVGYAAHGRRMLLTRPVAQQGGGVLHQARKYTLLAHALGDVSEQQLPAFELSQQDKNWAQSLLSAAGAKKIIALHPGAAYGPTKRWFPQRFVALAQRLSAQDGTQVLLLGSAKEKEALQGFLKEARFPMLDMMGKTDLGQLMALIACSDVLVANDSGPMHLAALLGTPVVALFGSTDPAATAPLGPHRIVRKEIACSPCLKRRCRNTAHALECLDEITVDDVMRTIHSVTVTECIVRVPGLPSCSPNK